MRISTKKFLCFVVVMLLCGTSHAQVLSGATSSTANTKNVSASSSKNGETSLLPKTQTNFDPDSVKFSAPENDPQVLHFKVVNGKISVEDPENRKILVYYDNYKLHRGFDKLLKCSIRVYVINDLNENITSLGFRLKWPEIATAVEMRQVKHGVKTYTDLMLLGDGCLRMDKTPTIEVNRCRVKGMTQEQCADAVQWLPR
jgi:hypothetical protein